MPPLRSFDGHDAAILRSVPRIADADNENATDLSFWWNFATISKKVPHLFDLGLQVSLIYRRGHAVREHEVLVDLGPRKRSDGVAGVEWVVAPMGLEEARSYASKNSDGFIAPVSWKIMNDERGMPIEFAVVTESEYNIIDLIMSDPSLPSFVSEFSTLLEGHNSRDLFGLKISLSSRPTPLKASELNLTPIEVFDEEKREHITRHNIIKNDTPPNRTTSTSSLPSHSSSSPPPLIGSPHFPHHRAQTVSSSKFSKTNPGMGEKYVFYFSSGTIEFRGVERIPKKISIQATTSSVVLDLTTSVLPPGEMQVTLSLSTTSLKIVAPDNVFVTTLASGSVGCSFKDKRDPTTFRNAQVAVILNGTMTLSAISVESPPLGPHPTLTSREMDPLPAPPPSQPPPPNPNAPPMILKSGDERKTSNLKGTIDLVYRKTDIFPRKWIFDARMSSVTLDLASGTLQAGDTTLVLNLSGTSFTITVGEDVGVALDGVSFVSV
ncbi:hypothetical protein HDU67_003656 [Dinochytrium kinnereticum]|nr:hypothetical protein HDU67_003656 [Dinochytrium kinnereticum]